MHLKFVLIPMHGLCTFSTRRVHGSIPILENLELQFLSPQHFETIEFLAFHIPLLAFVLMHFDLYLCEKSTMPYEEVDAECRQHFTMLFTFWDLDVSNSPYFDDPKFPFLSSQTIDTTKSTPLLFAKPLFSILWISKYPERINEGQIFD